MLAASDRLSLVYTHSAKGTAALANVFALKDGRLSAAKNSALGKQNQLATGQSMCFNEFAVVDSAASVSLGQVYLGKRPVTQVHSLVGLAPMQRQGVSVAALTSNYGELLGSSCESQALAKTQTSKLTAAGMLKGVNHNARSTAVFSAIVTVNAALPCQNAVWLEAVSENQPTRVSAVENADPVQINVKGLDLQTGLSPVYGQGYLAS